jgi:hypothetical protein
MNIIIGIIGIPVNGFNPVMPKNHAIAIKMKYKL